MRRLGLLAEFYQALLPLTLAELAIVQMVSGDNLPEKVDVSLCARYTNHDENPTRDNRGPLGKFCVSAVDNDGDEEAQVVHFRGYGRGCGNGHS